jgi:hypothetical protein
MSEEYNYNSDMGAIFQQRYKKDVLGKKDIEKGIGSAIGTGLGALAGNAIAPGLGGTALGAIGGSQVGGAFDKDEKMEKEEDMGGDAISASRKMEKEYKVVDTGLKGERVGEVRKVTNPVGSSQGGKAPAPKIQRFDSKKGFVAKAELRKAVSSIDSFLSKMDKMDGSKAGLKIKNVSQKDDGSVFPKKNAPKPQQRKG